MVELSAADNSSEINVTEFSDAGNSVSIMLVEFSAAGNSKICGKLDAENSIFTCLTLAWEIGTSDGGPYSMITRYFN